MSKSIFDQPETSIPCQSCLLSIKKSAWPYPNKGFVSFSRVGLPVYVFREYSILLSLTVISIPHRTRLRRPFIVASLASLLSPSLRKGVDIYKIVKMTISRPPPPPPSPMDGAERADLFISNAIAATCLLRVASELSFSLVPAVLMRIYRQIHETAGGKL